jgi:hypothetical protein
MLLSLWNIPSRIIDFLGASALFHRTCLLLQRGTYSHPTAGFAIGWLENCLPRWKILVPRGLYPRETNVQECNTCDRLGNRVDIKCWFHPSDGSPSHPMGMVPHLTAVFLAKMNMRNIHQTDLFPNKNLSPSLVYRGL